MIFFRYILIILLTSLFLFSTIYEDAEDKKTSRWKLLTLNTPNSIANVKDTDKKSRIIVFEGGGTKDTYALKVKQEQKDEHWLSWQMQFSEDFVIIVVLNTNRGEHYLIYTPGTQTSYMQYGLGDMADNGLWKSFSRNLQDDIAYFDNRVKVISLKSFVLKGNGKIDNLMTRKNDLAKDNLTRKIIKKKSTNTLPVIRLQGSSLVELELAEAYVEAGVSAYDEEDGDINVVSMENIDTNEAGRYMVLYMATDSHGNMALDKRYVHVGEVKVEETIVRLDEVEIEDEQVELSEEEEQIRIWEKELALREKELAQKENNSNKNSKKD